jgi:uncharacterized coiled-coil protein SlyX
MNPLIQFKPTIPRKSTHGLPRKEQLPRTQALQMIRGFLLIALLLAWFALASTPDAFGVVPAPDGGYPRGNTAEGDNALLDLTTGESNTAIGLDALSSNTTGSNNTANGFAVLLNNTTASDNTGTGFQALEDNMTGSFNTANGSNALFRNTTGSNNTADGADALTTNTIGHENTATGVSALFSNTTGSNNTATGVNVLISNTTGIDNTAIGSQALFSNTTGNFNTADGFNALIHNTTGNRNTANGVNALIGNTIGGNNTAEGVNALLGNTTGNNNTANGEAALLRNTTGSSNIALGINAGGNLTIGNSNIDIGNAGVAAEANTIRVGTQGTQRRAFIAGISGTAVTGSPVVVNASGQLGVAASSERFKDEIKRMDKASEAILALQPVTFRYKKDIDPDRVPQFGLVAEDVAKVNRDLVARDAKGEVYTVRYDAVNAMLLNEFLKEHRKVQEQDVTIAQVRSTAAKQGATIAEQQEQIEALTAGLQKVSAQIEASKPPPQMLVNNR